MTISNHDTGAASWKRDKDDDDSTTGDEESVDLLAPPVQSKRRVQTPNVTGKSAGKKQSRASTAPSPATRTLDSLSQHDAIGGGDLLYEMNEKEEALHATESKVQNDENGTDTKTSKKPRETTDGDTSNKGTHPASNTNNTTRVPIIVPTNAAIKEMSLSQPGPLGMIVVQGTGPSNGGGTCLVKTVVEGEAAHAAGMKKGDVLLRVTANGDKIPISYNEVATWTSAPRPIRFLVVRSPERGPSNHHGKEESAIASKSSSSMAGTNVPSSNLANKPQSQTPTTPNQKNMRDRNNQDTTSFHAEYENEQVVPFCQGCKKNGRGRTKALHHELCPKHARFYASGGKKKLEMLRRGVEAGCKACRFEYERGKRKYERHTCGRGRTPDGNQNQSPLTVSSPPKSPRHDDTICQKLSLPIKKRESDVSESDLPDTALICKTVKKVLAIPFCRACKEDDSTLFHHALCPEHPQFENSGAKDTLELIRRGVKVGCKACDFQYQNGRVDRRFHHSQQCERRKVKSRNHQQSAVSSKKQSSQKAGRRKSTQTAVKSGPKKKATKKKGGESLEPEIRTVGKVSMMDKTHVSRLASSDRGEDDSNASELEQPLERKLSGKRKAGSATAMKSSSKKVRKKKAQEKRVAPANSDETQTRRNGRHAEKSRSQHDVSRDVGEEGGGDSVLVSSSKRTRKLYKQTTQLPVDGEDQSSAQRSKWVSCQDIWGPTGHVEEDVVLFCPSGGFTHHENIGTPNRFSLDPFDSQRCYLNSHTRPQDGYHVIQLSRDRMAFRPWGFTFRRHDFGGACLVDTVEPLSPAAVAMHVGNPERIENSPSVGAASLRVNDMILCANGKVVGGMTETGLSIELEVSGPELVLVVSRYKHGSNAYKRIAEEESSAWSAVGESMNNGRLHDWTEIGAVEEDKRKEVQLLTNAPEPLNREEASVSRDRLATCTSGDPASDKVDVSVGGVEPFPSDKALQGCMDDAATSCCTLAPENEMLSSNTAHQMQEANGNCSSEEEKEEEDDDVWEEDDDPWLGCICGEIHPKPIPVFWIQCDVCDAWYSVSKDCIGFGEEEVEAVDSWSCWACSRNKEDEHMSETGEDNQEEHTLSEYELLRLKNIARNNARLDSLGLLEKQVGSVERRQTRVARNEAVGVTLPRRQSMRIQTPVSCNASSIPPEGKEGVNSRSGAAGNGSSPQAHMCGDSSETVDCHQQSSDGSIKLEVLKPGTVVSVAARTWPGSNKLGGIGKVKKVHISEDGEVLYDVGYVLGGKESDIEAEYVTRHEFVFMANSSSLGTQS